jgi:nucleoside-diphosphate-sugar epimerase
MREYTGELAESRVLVTGGAGYVGSSVVRLLGDAGCRVVRLNRPDSVGPAPQPPPDAEDMTGDIRDRTVWDRALDGVDVVIHLAAQTSVGVANRDPPADLENNVLPLLYLLETCRRKGSRPAVVFASTATVVGLPTRLPVDEAHADRPVTIYDLHKWMAEGYLSYYTREGVVRGATLRLANVYGPGPRSRSADRGVLNAMVRRALDGKALTIYGMGEHLRDYVYIEDVARAFLAAATHIGRLDGEHFVVGSGQGHTVAEAVRTVADRVGSRTGRRVEVTHADPPMPLLPIERRDFVADITRFHRATGWSPGVGLVEGIDRTIDSFREGFL